MKKVLLLVFMLIFLVGCGKNENNDSNKNNITYTNKFECAREDTLTKDQIFYATKEEPLNDEKGDAVNVTYTRSYDFDKNGDKLLLTKYRKGFTPFALIAGFTEIGETLEETVSREVMEEAGLRVKNIQYYKSQPWGVVDDLLAGFYCEVDGDTDIHMDASELKLAEWKTRDEIELQPNDFSLTNEMMREFKEGRI